MESLPQIPAKEGSAAAVCWITTAILATFAELRSTETGEDSAAIRERVLRAREIQLRRFEGSETAANARMAHAQLRKHCALDSRLGDLPPGSMQALRHRINFD